MEGIMQINDGNKAVHFDNVSGQYDVFIAKVDHVLTSYKEELEENLGIIAKSGSEEFRNNNEIKDSADLIGKFGVGFYSAFMVSSTGYGFCTAH